MPKSSKFSSKRKNFIIPFLLILVILESLNISAKYLGLNSSFLKSKNVLGESIGPCSSGGLTTSTNKVFQMTYPNEDFQQLTNTDLLKDVSQLNDLTCLQYIDATDRTVKGDIKDLKNLLNLEVLSFYSNPDVGGDICSIKDATKLRSIKFAFNPKISGDISCLKNLKKLETFAMTHTNIKGDISVLANMPNLKAVYLSGTSVRGNICSLKSLTNLQELGIADEYPGNPDITGDLSCLNNLQKLKRVSIYNTKATNCEAFTKAHQGMEKTLTESGKQGGGGCSKESMKTLVDYAQKYEAKIGKEVQTQVRGQPNYRPGSLGSNLSGPVRRPNIFQRIAMWAFGLFGKTPPGTPGPDFQNGPEGSQNDRDDESPNQIRSQTGPGGCRSQSECDSYCNKLENRTECSNFQPPNRQ